MTKQDVIEQLCKMVDKVNDCVFHYSIPSDCFCKPSPSTFHFDKAILNFIRDAVDAKIRDHVKEEADRRALGQSTMALVNTRGK